MSYTTVKSHKRKGKMVKSHRRHEKGAIALPKNTVDKFMPKTKAKFGTLAYAKVRDKARDKATEHYMKNN